MKEIMEQYGLSLDAPQELDYEKMKKHTEVFLKQIDVNALVSVYADLKRKAFGWVSNGEEEKEFRKRMTEIITHPRIESISGDTIASLVIRVDKDGVAFPQLKLCTNKIQKSGVVIFPMLLKSVIHEMSHVASLNFQMDGDINRVGFRSSSSEEQRPAFLPLNEAFTEYVQDAVYSEYLRRTGNKDDAVVSSYGSLKVKYDREEYAIYREFLDCFIEELASESGFEKDLIVQSMLGHYMRADFKDELDDLYSMVSPKIKFLIEGDLKDDPIGFGEVVTNRAVRETRVISKLVLICKELLKTREGRMHVKAIFGVDLFEGKKLVVR